MSPAQRAYEAAYTPEERAARRKVAISAAQKKTWAKPDVRARRTAAIRAAWDDPLTIALSRHHR